MSRSRTLGGAAICFIVSILTAGAGALPRSGRDVLVPDPPVPALAGPHAAVRGSSPISDEHYGKLPVTFEENRGQADSCILFLARGREYELFLTRSEAVWRFDSKASPSRVVTMRLAGGNRAPIVAGDAPFAARASYFIGNDPKKWRRNIPTFARVKYREVYPGVDLVYHGTQRQLEYDFLVEPGADPSRIELAFEGIDRISVDDQGDLVMKGGDREIRFRRPSAYQMVDRGRTRERRDVDARFEAGRDLKARFRLGSYDPSSALVIDPTLVYATYVGGGNLDDADDIDVDGSGNAYIVGDTFSTDLPTSTGAYQLDNRGNRNMFVTKINPTGTAFVYSTYLGGTGFDLAYGIAVDSSGSAYVTGNSGSVDFPTTPGAYLRSSLYVGAIVAKLTADGSDLVYSTYLSAGSGADPHGIAVDQSGVAYVTGTSSSGLPTTVGAYDRTHNGALDVFIAAVNASGSDLVYSTYIGGSALDYPYGIAVDGAGNAYVTGNTNSTNFPTTPGAADTTLDGTYDSFVTALNAQGSSLIYSTLLGGNSFERGIGIAASGSGDAYVTGLTQSPNFFTTPSAYDRTFNLGTSEDAYVTHLDPAGTILYSTLLGGTANDEGWAIAVDASGSAYVTGSTYSTDFPTSPNTYDSTLAPSSDAFVTKLSASGSSLLYSTYLGGQVRDIGTGIALDGSGNAYVTGGTSGEGFPVTAGAPDSTSILGEAFVAKFSDADAGLRADLEITMTDVPDPLPAGASLAYGILLTNAGPDTARNVRITDTLPGSVQYIRSTGTGWTCTPGTPGAVCRRTTLPPGTAPLLTLIVTAPPAASVITNSVSASADESDPNPANNIAAVDTTVTLDVPDLMPQMENPVIHCDPSPAIGCTMSGTLTLQNLDVTFASATVGFTATCKKCPAKVAWKLSGLFTIGAIDLTNVPEHDLALYLSDDATLDAGDLLLVKKPVGLLRLLKAFDKSKPFNVKAKVPKDVDLSGKYLIVVQDASHAVAETDETNNAASIGPFQ